MTAVDVSYAIDGTGPPLYMVHGIGSRKTGWNKLLPYLLDRFTCVTYDLRGHGASPVPPTPYSLDGMVADLEALRMRLGHDAIHVIGHSLGGMIGPAYARAYPQHTLSVGLLSTAAGRDEVDRAKLAAVRAAMEDQGIEQVLGILVQRWYTDAFMQTRPEAVDERIGQVLDTPPEVFLSVFRLYESTEMAPWLHELTCPCLVLTGALDGGCNPRLNQFIASEIPTAELVILDGVKHSILIEAPERVAAPVREFLLRISQDR
jgi:pimeloyl-ACP methyl ester carboxylesterase